MDEPSVDKVVTALDVAGQIKEEVALMQGDVRASVMRALKIGGLLIEAQALRKKEKRKDDPWKFWVARNCGIQERTAQLWMRINRKYKDDPQRVAGLSLREVARLISNEDAALDKKEQQANARPSKIALRIDTGSAKLFLDIWRAGFQVIQGRADDKEKLAALYEVVVKRLQDADKAETPAKDTHEAPADLASPDGEQNPSEASNTTARKHAA